MEPHSKPKTVFMLFMWACLLAGSVLIVLHLFLPSILQKLLPPLISKKAGIPQISLTVRRIGLFSADFESAVLGDKSGPGMIIDRIKIDFSLAGLLKKEIKGIHISGIRLFVEYPNGNMTIPGLFPIPTSSTPDNFGAASRAPPSGTGLRISRIDVANATAFIKTGDHAIIVPFALSLLSSPRGMNKLSGEFTAHPYEQAITTRVDMDLAAATLHLDMETTWLALDQIPPVSDWIKGLEIENPAARVNVKSAIAFFPEGIKGNGTLETDFGQLPQNHDPAVISAPIRLSDGFTFDIAYDGDWSFAMIPPSAGKNPLAPSDGRKVGKSAILQGPLVFEISATGSASGGQANWKFSAPDFKIKDGSTTIMLGRVGFQGNVSWDATTENTRVAVSCLSDPLELKSEATHISLPNLSFSGQFEPSDGGPTDEIRISGVVDFSKASFFLPSSGVAITGISVRLPVCWPCNGVANAGEFSVASLQWDRKNIGSVSGTLRQDPSSLQIVGTHRSLLAPGLLVAFTGRFGISPDQGMVANLEYKNSSFKTKTPLDLGQFFPEAAGISLEGEIGFSGDFQYGPCGPKGGLNAQLLQGTFKKAGAGIDIEGLEAQIHFMDLFSFKSAPSQTIRFASAKLGGIQIQKGQIAFQVESPDSIFIEKSGFTWCNGNVDVHALRIKGGVNAYHVDLYCDRLNLAMLLDQFGAANADGRGAVNGKIPIRYENGKLLFEDGFLYSTPGQGGTIKVAQTEKLMAEIPSGQSGSVQMELAREALKSYDYNWATLGITTEGEDLLLRMELSGKPTHPLPFIYQKETGGFVRIQSGEKGSSFQGINLNINFRLPLDKMIQYRNILKMFD
jgi:hypothetical protein